MLPIKSKKETDGITFNSVYFQSGMSKISLQHRISAQLLLILYLNPVFTQSL